ncbi:hypothetical protein BSNK01_00880 [Bacillaceae bacterium]
MEKGRGSGMKAVRFFIVFLAFLLLSGCLYPEERRLENQIPPQQWIAEVQEGIDKYYAQYGTLPILTKEANTPIYEKYVIDFNRLRPPFIPMVPANAFEMGGNYLYVLIDVEKKPTVKLLDLRLSAQVGNVQQQVNAYRRNNGRLPIEREYAKGFYLIDYEALRSEPVLVKSPYSDQYLSLVMNERGEVGINYDLELARILREKNPPVKKGEDIRYLLTDDSPFVPVKSFPYTVAGGEPVLQHQEQE